MKITRRKLKELLSEALSEASFEDFGDEEEEYDVEELASYHALNGDIDAILYKDNPDYRNAFIDMIIMKFGEERMQQFQDEEEDKEERRLLMDPDDEPYEIDESRYRVADRNPGMSSRERAELESGSDDPYYTSEPFEEEEPAPVLSPEAQEERNRREIEQRKILRQRQAMMRRMLSDYEY